MIDWLAPALGFILVQGVLGITIKLALRTSTWPQLVIWAALTYAVIATSLLTVGGVAPPLGAGALWGAVSGLCAAVGLVVLFLALRLGEASRVVPVTAGYPVAGAIFAAIFLGESVTPLRLIGTGFVVLGVILLARH